MYDHFLLLKSVFRVIAFVSDDSVHSVCTVKKLAVVIFTVIFRLLSWLCVSTLD